jgi:hypothetical protein
MQPKQKKLREILNTPFTTSICEPNCLRLKRKCCPTVVKILKNLVRDPYSKKYHLQYFIASTEGEKELRFFYENKFNNKETLIATVQDQYQYLRSHSLLPLSTIFTLVSSF